MGRNLSPFITQFHDNLMTTTSPYFVAHKKFLLTYYLYAASAFFTYALSGLVLVVLNRHQNTLKDKT